MYPLSAHPSCFAYFGSPVSTHLFVNLEYLLTLYISAVARYILNADTNECLSMPCVNGATCTDTEGSFFCTCTTGFTGQLCADGKFSSDYLSRPSIHALTSIDCICTFQCFQAITQKFGLHSSYSQPLAYNCPSVHYCTSIFFPFVLFVAEPFLPYGRKTSAVFAELFGRM